MRQAYPKYHDEAIFALLVGAFILTVLVCFIIAFVLLYQKKRAAHVQEMEAFKSELQDAILQTQLETQEQTLQHISREIHDNLSHTASIIKIYLNTIQWDQLAAAIVKVEATKELTRQMITDLKTLSVRLNGGRIVETGLEKALEIEAEKINKTGIIQVSLASDGNTPDIEQQKLVILYRMVQELLNNMLKHSKATLITIGMASSENLLTLVLNDNGVGFDVEAGLISGGAGLQNLQHRARLINAKLTMKSGPGEGSIARIELPF